MKIERAKNASRNIIFGGILKLYQIVIPFCMRTAMNYFLGVEYLGLNSLFTSVLQVLNLAELGVGSAMVFSMYKPIVEDDKATICALMGLYKKYYTRIGIVIAIIGLSITPFIQHLIRGEVPKDINIYILYLLNLSATVMSYWLFAYKSSILQAHQRTDVISRVTIITSTVQYIIQFFVLWVLRDYYLFIITTIISQAGTNIAIAAIATRLYPDYKPVGKLQKSDIENINQRIKDLFTAKLGGIIVGSVDTIVISAFLGLTVLAVYQNYYFIMNSICGFITVIFTAVTAGIGNSLVTETIEKNYDDLRKFTFIICFILCVCCCCFVGLYQPFMEIWMGRQLMLTFDYVIIFCILFYVLELSMVWATIKDAAGLWHSDRYRPLFGAMANLVLNIILVHQIGLYGIMLSTIISYVFISMPWLIYNLFSILYKKGMWSYIGVIMKYIGITILCCILTYFSCAKINASGMAGLMLRFMICLTISCSLQLLFLYKSEEYNKTLQLIRAILKK